MVIYQSRPHYISENQTSAWFSLDILCFNCGVRISIYRELNILLLEFIVQFFIHIWNLQSCASCGMLLCLNKLKSLFESGLDGGRPLKFKATLQLMPPASILLEMDLTVCPESSYS